MDINKHKFLLSQILVDIFKCDELKDVMAFKGGTALMMFHKLNRFSTDLDFNLLDTTKTEEVFAKVRHILTRYGTIDDEAMKFYGPVLVLNYGKGERMLKVEISTRAFDNHYEILNFAGTDIRVMTIQDMFAHKLCALGERATPRDIFDVGFFLKNQTAINAEIVKFRTGKSIEEYAKECANIIRETNPKSLMQGLGEVLMDVKIKNWVRSELIEETATALELFAMYPLLGKSQEQDK